MPERDYTDAEKKYYLLETERRTVRRALKDTEHALTHVTDPAVIAEYREHVAAFKSRQAVLDAKLKKLRPTFKRDHAKRMESAGKGRKSDYDQGQQQ